jgi:malate dehydrogenase (oxaloacetate-decarboxylating)
MKTQHQTLKNQRIVIAGAGSAAMGIGTLLAEALRQEGVADTEARQAIWLVDTKGLVHAGRTDLSAEKSMFAQNPEFVRAKGLDTTAPVTLRAVIDAVRPTALLGATGQPGMFDEALVRSMAAFVERPIIFPLSNPTSKSEAKPEDLIRWTDGRALIATGSPYPAVEWKGSRIPIGQCNNALIFPGIGLGLTVSAAKFVPDELFLAAARALAAFDERLPAFESSLFPNLEHVRRVSVNIALAVGQEILRQGLSLASLTEKEFPDRLQRAMWEPVYPILKRVN